MIEKVHLNKETLIMNANDDLEGDSDILKPRMQQNAQLFYQHIAHTNACLQRQGCWTFRRASLSFEGRGPQFYTFHAVFYQQSHMLWRLEFRVYLRNFQNVTLSQW
jgi:hypothetical protein